MICVLTGGTGGAKFVDGLRQVMPAEEITLIVNTGDDLLWWGLYVSPDIDSITYVLSGMLSRERGWGVKGDTFLCLQAMGQLGEPTWFHTGDRDLAVHLLRSRHLAEGKTLSEATALVCEKLGVKARILPMSDSRVETRVDTPVGELSFEEYFVQRWYQDPVNSVRFAGASDAEPAPGVIEAIEAADAILIAPSNPVTSIGPILAVPGIREALCRAKCKIGAISPIISGAAVNGPAGILMVAQGLPSSIAGVAQAYEDFLDVLICDTRDSRPAEVLRKTGVRVQCAQTIMRTPEDKAELARKALALVSASPVSEQGAAGQTSSDHTSSDQASSGQSSSDKAASDTAPSENASSEQTPAEEAPASRPFIRFRSVDDPS
ncbi:MAG: 2-phospho-L-lactate transferase [Candidatus Sulfotelmatobacter sp.]|jgi:LPPG:FO 2-phospho-L-lactate transferase